MDGLSAQALNRRIAERVKRRRLERDLTLDGLAAESGVSRAMISKIERGEVSPTAPLLARLANGLGVTISAMFDADMPASPLNRRAQQTTWRDPETGYIRRNVSPRGLGAPMEIVDVELPPGARVMFDNGAPNAPHQYVWLLDGDLEMTVDGQVHVMARGDCLHMRLDEPLVFHNPGDRPARYAVVIESGAGAKQPGPMIVRAIDAAEAIRRNEELAEILLDCIAGGASVSFLADLRREAALAFWRGVAEDVASDGRALLVAENDGRLDGTVQVVFIDKPNQPHRAEIAKMLVHRRARRNGIGRALLQAAETAALARGRWLMVLDTETGSAGERLYARGGWRRAGVIPHYALTAEGALCDTTVFYKDLRA